MTQAAYDPGVPGSLPPSPPIDAATAAETAGAIFQGPGNYTLSIQGVPRGGAITVYVWLDGIFSAGTGARGPGRYPTAASGCSAGLVSCSLHGEPGQIRSSTKRFPLCSRSPRQPPACPCPACQQAAIQNSGTQAAPFLEWSPSQGRPGPSSPLLGCLEPWPGKTSGPYRPKSEIANSASDSRKPKMRRSRSLPKSSNSPKRMPFEN